MITDSRKKEEVIRDIKLSEHKLRELRNTEAWKDLVADMMDKDKQINNCWHECFDEKKLAHLRIMKHSCRMILSMEGRYEADLEADKLRLKGIEEGNEEIY